jgi:hypothetical protein
MCSSVRPLLLLDPLRAPRFELDDGPLAFTLTDPEARWLLTQIQQQLER